MCAASSKPPSYDEDLAAPTLAYAALGPSVRDLGRAVDGTVLSGIAENVTVVPKTIRAADVGQGRSERILTIRETTKLNDVLRKNGFTDANIAAIDATLQNVFPSTDLPPGCAPAHPVRAVAQFCLARALPHEHLPARQHQ